MTFRQCLSWPMGILTAVAGLVLITAPAPRAQNHANHAQVTNHSNHAPAEVVSTIDGAKDPGSIPDAVAYQHFFTVLAKTPTRAVLDDARRRSYLKFYFRPNCGKDQNEDRTLTDEQIDKLLSVVDELIPQLRAIGLEATALKGVDPASPNVFAIKQKQEDAIMRAAASIPGTVGADGATKIARHVAEHVRSRIKINTVRIPVAR